MTDLSLDEAEHVSLCEALDRILNKGAVITGDLTISVADIDLIYVGSARPGRFGRYVARPGWERHLSMARELDGAVEAAQLQQFSRLLGADSLARSEGPAAA